MLATLFDYNGVLIDDETTHLAAFRQVLSPHGFRLSDQDYFENLVGFDDQGFFREVFERRNETLSQGILDDLIAQKKLIYMTAARGNLSAFAGADALVRRRAKRGPVGVVSGALREEIELGLELMGVRDLVETIVSAEDAESKPNPQGYSMGLAQLGVEQAVVVEDTVAGVRAARGAGCACLAVAHTTPAAALKEAGAKLVREHISKLTDSDFDTAFVGPDT